MNFARACRFLSFPFPAFTGRWPKVSLAVTAIAFCEVVASGAEAEYNLQTTATSGFEQQVKVVVEVAGDLKVNADGKEVQRLPLTVAAEMHYSERILAGADQKLTPAARQNRTVRHYHTAVANIRIQGSESTQTLREERRMIAAQISADKATLFSPLGPLTREELELIDVPGTRISLDSLLPERSIAIGDTWKWTDTVAARLVNLDAVTQQDVECKLEEVKADVAIIAASGRIAGAIGGISSDIDLQAKLNFDLKRRCVTWVALALKEDRAVGHAQPGYQTTTRIRLVAAPSSAAPQLSDKQLAGLDLVAKPASTLLELSTSKGGYELLHDRRWHVMTDHFDVAVMRLIDRGDLVAQCNLSKLPALPKGQQLTLEGFQQDVKKSLAKSFGQFVEAGEDKNDNGIRILRVTVSGFASELPIHWIYYHLSDDHGRRASLVFTMEAKLVERYAQLDREVISGFRFLDLPVSEPTPAAQASESATRTSADGAQRK